LDIDIKFFLSKIKRLIKWIWKKRIKKGEKKGIFTNKEFQEKCMEKL
jgi:hypothetical protein